MTAEEQAFNHVIKAVNKAKLLYNKGNKNGARFLLAECINGCATLMDHIKAGEAAGNKKDNPHGLV